MAGGMKGERQGIRGRLIVAVVVRMIVGMIMSDGRRDRGHVVIRDRRGHDRALFMFLLARDQPVLPARSCDQRRRFAGSDGGVTGGALLAAAAFALLFLFFVAGCLHNAFPVGDRDLIVVGMDFAEREEPVAIAAVLDECGLSEGSTRTTLAR